MTDSEEIALWSSEFRRLHSDWVKHLTTDPLDSEGEAALHAAILEALMKAVAIAMKPINDDSIAPLLYLVNAMQSFIGGAKDDIIRPVSRPNIRTGIGRPQISTVDRMIALYAVFSSRLLVERGGWRKADADMVIASELNRLLPTSARKAPFRASTIAGWRRGRNAMLLDVHRTWLKEQLAQVPMLHAQEARSAVRKQLAIWVSDLPIGRPPEGI